MLFLGGIFRIGIGLKRSMNKISNQGFLFSHFTMELAANKKLKLKKRVKLFY